MTVSILGCGWYGTALARQLISKGIHVKGSATSQDKAAQLSLIGIRPYLVQFNADNDNFNPDFFECDVLVVSIPPKFKKGEKDNYLLKISRIIIAILQFNIKRVIYISSTGVYGDHNREVNELNSPEPDTEQGRILQQAEKLFQSEQNSKISIIRFGGLVGPGRHPGHFFAGKSDIPNGLAPVNLIHLEDCTGISLAVIDQDTFGYVINAVSPDHPAKSEFYKIAASQAGLPAPEFINELNNWKIVNSAIISGLLNYQFKIQDWRSVKFDV